MPIVLDGTQGISTPMYAGSISSNAVTPVIGMKNKIINGACVIDQRNAGASVTNVGSASTYTLDRWFYFASQASKFTVQQNAGSVTPPAGFTNYLGITSSSAYTVGSSEIFLLAQHIEGFNTADLAWGTANAKTVTLSFWVRSSLTGTFGGSLRNADSDRSYPFTYTISSANTWEQKSVTVAGDTTGTWGTGNGTGIRLAFGLGMGSTFSGTAGAWAGANYISATGATSVVGVSGATFFLTGVQLEIGSTATSFDYRPYGTELQLCQRYFYIQGGGVYTRFGGGIAIGRSSTVITSMTMLPVPMRTFPTITASNLGSTSINATAPSALTTNASEASVGYPLTGPIRMVLTVSGGASAGVGYEWEQSSGTSTISYSAEL